MSIEAGGSNSTVPFRVAAEVGIPVVDADGMGVLDAETGAPLRPRSCDLDYIPVEQRYGATL
jgi:Protein of unknown function (DUF917)